jgi:antitoxin CptB
MDKPTAPLGPEARRLLWRCRRGMKELDVLLERFARGELPSASSEQRLVFARLLELPDPVLVDYLLGQEIPPDPELAQLARRITSIPPDVTQSSGFRSSAD